MRETDGLSEPFGVDPADVAGATLIDVRRKPAYDASPWMLPTAVWRDPFGIDDWAANLAPQRRVVVYCVYGHEVSRGAAMHLRAQGIDAYFLRGGIDGWQAVALPLVDKGAAP